MHRSLRARLFARNLIPLQTASHTLVDFFVPYSMYNPGEFWQDSKMFTGLVEGCGIVTGIFPAGESVRIEIESPLEMSGEATKLHAGQPESAGGIRGGTSTGDCGSATGSNSTPIEDSGRATHFSPELQAMVAETVRRELAVANSQTVRLGDSIAINGCCLTVIAIQGGRWSFQAGAETLSKTTVGRLKVGQRVNLERSLAVGSRFGGHFVLGHVDGVGGVERIETRDGWSDIWFSLPPQLAPFLIPKGSIAVDGVSLTLVHCESGRFSVALIPHTLAVTTLGERKIGDLVNLEMDVIAKHVHRLVSPHLERHGPISTA